MEVGKQARPGAWRCGVKGSNMRVELALFDGDALLDQGEFMVATTRQTESFPLYRASHQPGNAAAMVLEVNSPCKI